MIEIQSVKNIILTLAYECSFETNYTITECSWKLVTRPNFGAIFISYFQYWSERDFSFSVNDQNSTFNFWLWRMNVHPKLIMWRLNVHWNWLLVGRNLRTIFDFYFLFSILEWKWFWFSVGCSKSGFQFSTLAYECSSRINYAVTECSWELVADRPKFGDSFQFLFLISSVIVKEMWVFRWWVTCTNLIFLFPALE